MKKRTAHPTIEELESMIGKFDLSELNRIYDEVASISFEGPTFQEYFDSLNSQYESIYHLEFRGPDEVVIEQPIQVETEPVDIAYPSFHEVLQPPDVRRQKETVYPNNKRLCTPQRRFCLILPHE